MFEGMWIVKRASLRHYSGKYREAEGAPGSLLEPGSCRWRSGPTFRRFLSEPSQPVKDAPRALYRKFSSRL